MYLACPSNLAQELQDASLLMRCCQMLSFGHHLGVGHKHKAQPSPQAEARPSPKPEARARQDVGVRKGSFASNLRQVVRSHVLGT